ncbi:kinase-like protein [Artomyces pyxidatus]|uniref:Kinase-like protein n=1 Tax=Artomyces pyxidatus TaxID=48021 RepID=A0ACB8SH60_9AGAM|nr:kinase-like protein [Artomyces pyxidatus]
MAWCHLVSGKAAHGTTRLRKPVAVLSDFIGKIVHSTYELIGVLGTGGCGVVFRAVDITSFELKEYALKCLSSGAFDLPEYRPQRHECLIHSKVDDHPNIVSIHRVIEAGEYIFIVLDLCAGGDLFSAITQKGIYFRDDDLIKRAFTQLLDAVQHCHDRGVYHRDLKPENVLCSSDGSQLFLADFGLATEEALSPNHGVGSRPYMSPECIGEEISFPVYCSRGSDVWSLGVILVNMITSRCPWRTAVTDDDGFSSFLHDPNFLLTILPLSKEANALLRRVFTLNPFIRITLPEFRQEMLEVKTFFMTDDEIAQSSPIVHEAPIPITVLDVESFTEDKRSSNSSLIRPLDSDEVYLFDIYE